MQRPIVPHLLVDQQVIQHLDQLPQHLLDRVLDPDRLAQPDLDAPSIGIDLPHVADVLVALRNVGLVDADGVDPEP